MCVGEFGPSIGTIIIVPPFSYARTLSHVYILIEIEKKIRSTYTPTIELVVYLLTCSGEVCECCVVILHEQTLSRAANRNACLNSGESAKYRP